MIVALNISNILVFLNITQLDMEKDSNIRE
jgi:hypothetical protein